jgi:hypothetical protein
MIELNKVTLVAISSININETIDALQKSKESIKFFDCILLTHERPENLPNDINFIKIRHLESKDEYSRFCIYELKNFIKSEFVLVVQHDGYVLRPYKWKDYFMEYDYIGAPWPNDGIWSFVRVGNGGFSLRSKKMLDVPTELNLHFDVTEEAPYRSEDMRLCVYFRKELEGYGIKYAPVNIAAEFSHELNVPEIVDEPFGFHINKI